MRLLKILILGTLLTLCPLTMSNAASTLDTPQILSYYELIRLKPAQRAAYIAGLRTILVDAAKTYPHSKGHLIGDSRAADYSWIARLEYIAPFFETMTPAYAAGDATSQVSCPPPWFHDENTGPNACRVIVTGTRDCPSGFVQHGTFGSYQTQLCVPDPKLNAQKAVMPVQRADAQPPVTIAPSAAPPPLNLKAAVVPPPIAAILPSTTAQPIPPSSTAVQPVSPLVLTPGTQTLPGYSQPNSANFAAPNTTTATGEPRVTAVQAPQPPPPPQQPTIDPATGKLVMPPPQNGPTMQAAETKYNNDLKKSSADYCKNVNSQKALQKFRSTQKAACIYAGSMSCYPGDKREAGKCQPVKKFCVSKQADDPCDSNKKKKPDTAAPDTAATNAPAPASNPAVAKAAPADSKEGQDCFECTDKSKSVICNPLVYGLKDSKTPYCVAQSANATEDCTQIAGTGDKKGAKSTAATGGVSTDAFLNASKHGIADSWNDFSDRFKEACSASNDNSDAQCQECHYISQKLANLKANIGNNDSSVDLIDKIGNPNKVQ